MTTLLQARDAIVSFLSADLSANQPDLPVFWENTLEVDMDTVGERFLRIEIDFDGAQQMTINGPDVHHKTWGLVHCTLMVKEGAGIRTTLALLDYLTTLTAYKYLLGTAVFLGTPMPGPRRAKDGWRSYDLSVSFEFDTID